MVCLMCPICLPCQMLCTFRGVVFISSLIMSLSYFAVMYACRMIAFPVLNDMHGTWHISIFFKDQLETWIELVKTYFYVSTAYCVLGLCGLVGVVFMWRAPLIVYLIYLIITWCFNAYEIYLEVKSILALQKDLEKACNIISLGAGNCDEWFSTLKTWTIQAACAVLLLHAFTAICVGILLWRIKRKNAANADSDTERNVGHRRRRRRSGRRRKQRLEESEAWEEGEKGIPLLPLRRPSRRSPLELETDSEEANLDATFELPRWRVTRAQKFARSVEEEVGPLPPPGRRRRGSGGGEQSRGEEGREEQEVGDRSPLLGEEADSPFVPRVDRRARGGEVDRGGGDGEGGIV